MTIEAIQIQFIGNDNVNPTYGTNLQEYLLQNNIERSSVPSFIHDFSNSVITSLKNRFPNRKLYWAMRIYDPQQLPIDNKDLLNYGEEEIDILCDFYGTEIVQNDKVFSQLLEKRDLKSEWGLVKLYLKNFRNLKFINAWQKIFSIHSYFFPF